MDIRTITLGPLAVPIYTALIAAAALLGLAAVVITAQRHQEPPPLHWLDAGLGALVGGVLGARLLHVLLHWHYFADHLAEIPSLGAGGLDWHGAVFGGLVGVFFAARWRKVPLPPLLDALALSLPLFAMAAWGGCGAANCAYGAEVWTLADYPAWAVSERADIYGIIAPRFHVQMFGVWLGAGLLVIAGLLARRDVLRGARLWLLLFLLGGGMFGLAYFRGDQAASFLPGLSQTQLLDGLVIAVGAAGMLSSWQRGAPRSRRQAAL